VAPVSPSAGRGAPIARRHPVDDPEKAAASGAAPDSPGTGPLGKDQTADDDEASPDDPDAGVRGLTGVPLVLEMLGGTVLEEIEQD
jgi:DNA polymerase-3 subunit gamma/tau